MALVGRERGMAPARLLVADAWGNVGSVELDRVAAGRESRSDGVLEERVPALTVDAAGRRAYVFSPDRLIAAVDLDALTVTYHDLDEERSLLARLAGWLHPPAHAKASEGPTRYARWLGDGLIAVTGSDDDAYYDGEGVLQLTTRPAGLKLVDVHDWSVREVDATTTYVRVGGGALLATGWSWDSPTQTETHMGVTVYDLTGRKRFSAFRGRPVRNVVVFARRLYVELDRERAARVLDLRTGREVGRGPKPLPRLLAPDAASGDR